MNMSDTKSSKNSVHQQFVAPFDYPVHFTRHVFAPDHVLLRDTFSRLNEPRKHRVIVFVDDGVHHATPGLIHAIESYFTAHATHLEYVRAPIVIPGGEAIKNDYRRTMEIVDTLLEYRMCRQSFVLIIGGGAVLDAVGFAASIVHRGLRVVRMPSTVLAQNDAGVGVKTGMNLHGGKNTIGTFHPPFAVINDLDLLNTLPQEHWIGGVSEAFKVAMIKDADFFRTLCRNATHYRNRDERAMEELVIRCAELHLEHIRTSGDPFELGRARPLDFGHWAAHKLESMTHYRVGHGEAVAVGLALDALYAAEQGWLDESDAASLLNALHTTGFHLWHPEMDRRLGDGQPELLRGLLDFQEHLGGELCVTFPRGLGQKREAHTIDHALMEKALAQLKPRA